MLFTWDTTNLCIIFRWWHISSTLTLLISLAAVAVLTAGYELVRELSRRYELSSAEYMNSLPSESLCPFRPVLSLWSHVKCLGLRLSLDMREVDDDNHERSSLLWSGKSAGQQEKKFKVVKAAFYAVQVFYSFFIM